MARPNRPRSIGGEDNLARRVAYERGRREWSYETLARRMTEAGCPIQASALHRVEKGKPRRRVTVDELIALAQVFGVPVDDLLTDMELLRKERLRDLIDQLEPAHAALLEAVERNLALWIDYYELAGEDPDGLEYVSHHWLGEGDDEGGDAATVNLVTVDPPVHDLRDLNRAIVDLLRVTWRSAGDIVEASFAADAAKED